jgi:hypothetical protein
MALPQTRLVGFTKELHQQERRHARKISTLWIALNRSLVQAIFLSRKEVTEGSNFISADFA